MYRFQLKKVNSKAFQNKTCGHECHFEVVHSLFLRTYVRTFVRNKNMPCCFDSLYGRRDKTEREVSEHTKKIQSIPFLA